MIRYSACFLGLVKRSVRSIWTVSTCEHNLTISQDQDDQQHFKFPFVWLRDNCQCSKCFHQPSNSRIIHIQQFNFDAVPKTTKISDNHVQIEWTDKHESDYSLKWLLERQFTEAGRKCWRENYGRKKQLSWTAKDFKKILKKFQYGKLLQSDDELYDWLEMLAVRGIAIIEDAALKEGEIKKLADRVAFLKKTQYGEIFRVEAKPGTTNVAYLNSPLQLHTDLPYYEYKPGVNLLHCIIQGNDGGDNQLSDCLAVAKAIKSTNPSTYSILKDTPIIWSDKCSEDGKDYHSIHIGPIIRENEEGIIERINFSQPQRDSHLNIPLEKVQCWYNALRMFSQKLYSPEYCVEYKLEPGQILTFDNLRLVHGRMKYEGHRFLEGGYLDWDHIYSRLRILQSRYD